MGRSAVRGGAWMSGGRCGWREGCLCWLPRSWGNSWVDGDGVTETAGGRLDWGKSNGQSCGHV